MELKHVFEKQKIGKFAADEQTGKIFELETETLWDIAAATLSAIYLFVMLIFFAWQLLDIATGRMALLTWILNENVAQFDSAMYQTIAYAVIGGGLGGIVNGFRSILSWHAERKAFGWRHLWKYIALPLLGATLAAMVYSLTRAGIAVIGGVSTTGGESVIQAFSAFAIGSLSGYGAQKVFKWLDEHVNRIFKISEIADVEVPNLVGKTEQEAKVILRMVELSLGTISEQPTSDPDQIDKVVSQSPAAGTKQLKTSEIGITIARNR